MQWKQEGEGWSRDIFGISEKFVVEVRRKFWEDEGKSYCLVAGCDYDDHEYGCCNDWGDLGFWPLSEHPSIPWREINQACKEYLENIQAQIQQTLESFGD